MAEDDAHLDTGALMTGASNQRQLHEPYAGAWGEEPWPLTVEVANLLPQHSWSLVGGLMVQSQAHLHGVEVARATSDVDAILQLGAEKSAFGAADRALREHGFELSGGEKYAYRFIRGTDKVDVMIAHREKRQFTPTYDRRPLFPVKAGLRALNRTTSVALHGANGELARFSLPSLAGSLVLKASAFREDTRDKERHLEDEIVLLACVDDAPAIRSDLGKRSRKELRLILRELDENRRVWRTLPRATQARARERLSEMVRVFDAHGRDNSWSQQQARATEARIERDSSDI